MSFEKKYKAILKKAYTKGLFRNDRTKVGSYSIFNQSIKINISKYFPIVTGRKIKQNIFETEFNWFISGATSIDIFKKNNIKIWDNWADHNGNLGPVYGYQMINFNGQNINQLNDLINSIKNTPDSRRHIISLWNPLQLNDMALPPCYLYFQFFVEKSKLNLFVVQRSGDLFLGVPYDICLFALFQLYVSEKCNLKAAKLEVSIIDAHVYTNQINSIKEYLKQPILKLVKYKYNDKNLNLINYNTTKIITSKIAI